MSCKFLLHKSYFYFAQGLFLFPLLLPAFPLPGDLGCIITTVTTTGTRFEASSKGRLIRKYEEF